MDYDQEVYNMLTHCRKTALEGIDRFKFALTENDAEDLELIRRARAELDDMFTKRIEAHPCHQK